MPDTSFRTCCRICDGQDLRPVLDLGAQPWCNDFRTADSIGAAPVYPLRLVFCSTCRTAQLDYTVPKEVMFRNHTYVSGTTRTLSEHFRRVARGVDARVPDQRRPKTVLDIGANDGTQLQHFLDLGYETLGIEPARIPASRARARGIDIVEEFFDHDLAKRLDRRFDVVHAAGVFFHLEQLHSAAEGIRHVLADDGLFVVQFLYMKQILHNVAFDQIYHEHLLYYTLHTLQDLLQRHGLELSDAYTSAIHGGSVVAFATHAGRSSPSAALTELLHAEEESGTNRYETYLDFASKVVALRDVNRAYVQNQKARGKRIFGLGAPAKGNTLLNYFGFGVRDIECLVEKNPLRRGLVAPGSHIPIILEEDVIEEPQLYYVLAWNFREEILSNKRHALEHGVEFYFPIQPAPYGDRSAAEVRR